MTTKPSFYADYDSEINSLYLKACSQAIDVETEKSRLLTNIVGLYTVDGDFRRVYDDPEINRQKRLKYLSAARINLWHQFYEDREEAFQLRYEMLEENGYHRQKKFFKFTQEIGIFFDRQFNPVKQQAWHQYRGNKSILKNYNG